MLSWQAPRPGCALPCRHTARDLVGLFVQPFVDPARSISGPMMSSAWSDEEVASVRGDTPGVAHVLHLNNAGSSLPARETLDATVDYLRLEASHGGWVRSGSLADDPLPVSPWATLGRPGLISKPPDLPRWNPGTRPSSCPPKHWSVRTPAWPGCSTAAPTASPSSAVPPRRGSRSAAAPPARMAWPPASPAAARPRLLDYSAGRASSSERLGFRDLRSYYKS